MRRYIYPQLLHALDGKIEHWEKRKARAEHEGEDVAVVIAWARLEAYKEVRRWIEPWIESS